MNDDPNAFTDEEVEEMLAEQERQYMDEVLGIASYDEMDSWTEIDGIIFDNAPELYEYLAENYSFEIACRFLYDECAIRDPEKQRKALAPYYGIDEHKEKA